MKLEKWNEKTSVYLDTLLEKDQSIKENAVFYANTANGVYFADKSGIWARFLPDHQIYSVSAKNSRPFLEKAFEDSIKVSVLSDSITIGRTGGKNGKKCRKFQSGNMEVYVYETLLRDYPKNTLFYISGETKPVLCGIMENDVLHVIGLVMPFRVQNTKGFEAC